LDRLTHSRAFLVSGVFNDKDRPDKPSTATDIATSVLSWFGLTTENRAASGSTPWTPAILSLDLGIVSMLFEPGMMASMALSSSRGRRGGSSLFEDLRHSPPKSSSLGQLIEAASKISWALEHVEIVLCRSAPAALFAADMPRVVPKAAVGMQHRRSWLFHWFRCKFMFRGPETAGSENCKQPMKDVHSRFGRGIQTGRARL
jgi:hypothetical protein